MELKRIIIPQIFRVNSFFTKMSLVICKSYKAVKKNSKIKTKLTLNLHFELSITHSWKCDNNIDCK